MDLIRRGDDDRLETWLEVGYPSAYRTAFLILHNHQDAEEAVQEAFLRAWRFRSALPEGDAGHPWLYRVVVNACLSKLRADRPRAGRMSPLEVDLIDERHPSEAGPTDPESAVLSKEVRQTVLLALAGLPEHLRVVIVLRYFTQLSEREIAGVIGRRQGTVKSRLHEAKARLGRDPLLDHLSLVPADATGDGEGR